ncbi:MAG: hemerythrin domain-containing protein [Flavobacteriales bacterium]|nr:hemerythrin domain-containing protein [Flavobacteriales bacterium]
MHQAINALFEEHVIIIQAAGIARDARRLIETEPARYAGTMRSLLTFFREYADQYHHHKEEEVLFPEMAQRNELLADGVLQEMLENHADFRGMLDDIEGLLRKERWSDAQDAVERYCEALQDHIAVENDEVFHMAETLLNADELDRVRFRFEDGDRERGDARKAELAAMLDTLTTADL